MKKNKYYFEIHSYSPEQNKIFYKNINVTEFYKNNGLQVNRLTKNYKDNMLKIRSIKNNINDSKVYKVIVENSAILQAEKINHKYYNGDDKYFGVYKEYKGHSKNIVSAYNTIKNHLKENSSDNDKIFNLIVGFTEDKKPIYQNFLNTCKIVYCKAVQNK